MAEPRVTVLLIEDDDQDAYLIREMVASSGSGRTIKLEHVMSLAAGVEALSRGGADAVLLDLSLPDSLGADTFTRLHAEYPHVPIIVLSGLNDEKVALDTVQRGAQDYLVKGHIDGPLLTRAICYAIERKRVQEELRQARDELELRVKERTRELAGANRDLRKAVKRLEDHDCAKSAFVSNVSHELRTPLSSMIFALDNLLRGAVGPVPDRVMDYLKIFRENCQRLCGTVQDILNLTRIETNTLTMNRTKVSLPRLVAETVALFEAQADAKSVALRLDLREATGFVKCDREKTGRAIAKVVQNAIKFTAEGGSVDVIVSRPAVDGEALAVDVVDNGIGIDPEDLARVTERYFRVGKHIDGTGLGLSICKEMVELQGGQIELASPPEGQETGTRVSIVFPVIAPPRVLLIAGVEARAEGVRQQLERGGYEVETRALAAAGAGTGSGPEILVLDALGLSFERTASFVNGDIGALLRSLPGIAITEELPDPTKQELLEGLGMTLVVDDHLASELAGRIEERLPA